ncbi:AEC family transporter [Sulfurimonas sp.]|uniref:AEC family transporter n=2 Tax=Sulfurimonas sp. TaxID=2022749 RepID=UPI002B481BA7|nr:AEC family transporter [Sulfurimonas sp.]
MIFQILNIIFPIVFITLIGLLYAKNYHISMDTTNKINLEIFIPILVFYSISEKLPSILNLGYFSLGGVMVVFGSGVILYPITKMMGIRPQSFLPSMMFNNSINLGFPLALFAFGEDALVMFISLSLVQIIGQFTVAPVMYGGETKVSKILKNPVIIATIFGLFFNYFDMHFPQVINISLKMMSQVSIPLVLFALGVRLVHVELKYWRLGLLGAILCPISGIIMALLAIYIFDYTQTQQALIILFGALPPAVLNTIMAQQYKKDSVLVASVVAIGNIFSLISIPIVLYFVL